MQRRIAPFIERVRVSTQPQEHSSTGDTSASNGDVQRRISQRSDGWRGNRGSRSGVATSERRACIRGGHGARGSRRRRHLRMVPNGCPGGMWYSSTSPCTGASPATVESTKCVRGMVVQHSCIGGDISILYQQEQAQWRVVHYARMQSIATVHVGSHRARSSSKQSQKTPNTALTCSPM